MDKTFEEAISGIRHAERGVEVREDIAQGMEYVQSIADASEKSAEKSAASAESAEKSARGAALSASAAAEQAEKSTSSAAAAENSKTSAKESSDQANASQANAARYLQATKEYFEQVRTITIGAQGWYATPEALKAAVPVGENGWWAVVGTTDTIWTWDSDLSKWKDSAQSVDLADYYTKAQADAKFGPPYTLTKEAIAEVLGFTPTKITAGTEDLIPGGSTLESGTVYLVYSTASAASSDEVTSDTDIHLPEPEAEESVPDEEVVAP